MANMDTRSRKEPCNCPDCLRAARDGRKAVLPYSGLLQVRRRIAAGFYDRPDVLRITAARILETGDVLLPE